MPFNLGSLLHQPSAVQRLDLTGVFGSPERSLERQRLALAREQFDEQKRQFELNEKQEKEAAAAAAAKAELAAEKARAADIEKDRLAAEAKFGEHVAAANPEAAEALIPMMQNLGQGVDITRSATGMPSYRIHHDAAKDKATEAAEAARNWDGSRTSAARPLYADAYGDSPVAPAVPNIAPTTPTGAVLDMQTLSDQRLQRLTPALRRAVESHPEGDRESATESRFAVEQLGLPVDKAMEEFRAQRNVVASQKEAEAQMQRFREQRDELDPIQKNTLQTSGSNEVQELYKERGIDRTIVALAKADEVERVLDDDNRENDTMVASAVMDAQGVKGTPSNTDLEFAFNVPKGSVVTKLVSAIEEAVKGGLSSAQKAALKSYMKQVRQTATQNVDDYFNSAYGRLDAGDMHEEKAKSFKARLEQSVPAWMYNDYWDRKEKREAEQKALGGATSESAPDRSAVGAELSKQAEAAGLNAGYLGRLMAGESGGDTGAANSESSAKGVFQVIDETARGLGYKDAADYAAQPADKQIEGGLKLFKAKGLTKESPKEDYALVLAAPSLVGKWKSRDDVVYEKGSDEWKKNKPWRPAGGGAITVGSIADFYFGKGGAGANPYADLPEPTTEDEKELHDILMGGG